MALKGKEKQMCTPLINTYPGDIWKSALYLSGSLM